MLPGLADLKHAVFLHLGQRILRICHEQFGEPEYGVERCAQLVAHVGQKFGLGSAGFQGIITGLREGEGAVPDHLFQVAGHRLQLILQGIEFTFPRLELPLRLPSGSPFLFKTLTDHVLFTHRLSPI